MEGEGGKERGRETPDLLLQCLSHLHDACSLDVVGEIEGWLLNTPLALEVLPLEAPVSGHGDGVPSRLQHTFKTMHARDYKPSLAMMHM